MSIPFNESAIPGRHTLLYRVRDYDKGFPEREVEVLATPEEIQAFVRDGYLVRENLISMETVERLRAAFDEIVSPNDRPEKSGGKNFGGIFLRHMMDRHPAFLEFLKFPPTLSIARALFGPYVQHRGFTGRVCYPDDPYQETEWHFHQRLVPDPLPPMYSQPQTMDVLLYLDDIDDANGPLAIVPGSHHWIETDLRKNDFEDKEGQVILKLPAGSAVLAHGSLWHRSLPTQPGGTMRRLLLFGYGPGWQKPSIYGKKPENGLTLQLLEDPNLDEETKELLGIAGFM
ncbi:MAG: phytanoyl-CoA dioxygenase family protein [Armatimonadetes bacterium]|nr:phytanoyl-CoA dioxygenase family protein [Armatimonadota bacterium]